ncbi:MAG TPA: hypothetical protein VHL11_17915 [Phototrophicaceae bacterium]|nr:hypothetical protein [Phototrophicaceae bacterium]
MNATMGLALAVANVGLTVKQANDEVLILATDYTTAKPMPAVSHDLTGLIQTIRYLLQ